MDKHDNWHRIYGIYQGLLSYLKRSLDINFDFTPQQAVEHLKENFLDLIRKAVQATVQDFQEDERAQHNKGKRGEGEFWQYEYKNAEFYRDEHLESIILYWESRGDSFRGLVIQEEVIDGLKGAVISTTERSEVEVAKKTEELSRLQERINKMKEHTF